MSTGGSGEAIEDTRKAARDSDCSAFVPDLLFPRPIVATQNRPLDHWDSESGKHAQPATHATPVSCRNSSFGSSRHLQLTPSNRHRAIHTEHLFQAAGKQSQRHLQKGTLLGSTPPNNATEATHATGCFRNANQNAAKAEKKRAPKQNKNPKDMIPRFWRSLV